MVQNQYSVQFFFCKERDNMSFKLQLHTALQPATNLHQGKMKILLFIILTLLEYTVMEIDLGEVELPKNILKFGYGTNYKYVGEMSHSFDRFYVVSRFELPKVEDLQFDDIPYDAECAHLDNPKPGQIIGMI